MALIQCPECGKEISSKAEACIHCGFPLNLHFGSIEEEKKQENYRPQNIETNARIKSGFRKFIFIFIICPAILIMLLLSIFDSPQQSAQSTQKIEHKKTKTPHQNNKKSEEQRIFEAVKKVPASEIYKNRDMYKKLTLLAPQNNDYKQKLAYYNKQIDLAKEAAKIAVGKTFKIATLGTRARLCPYPNCGQYDHITRIPQGTELSIQGIKTVQNGYVTAKWFKVTYDGDTGWISIYDTDKQ